MERIRMELEVSSHFFSCSLFFFQVGFFYSRWRSTVTDGRCREIHLTRFFSTFSSLCIRHFVAQGAARRVCMKTCSCTCHHVSERLLFLFSLLPPSLVRLRSLSLLLVLCPAFQPPCGRFRRALNPMRTRGMRSIAPWRYTTLSKTMRPRVVPCMLRPPNMFE